MRWPWQRRLSCPSDDARCALEHSQRQLEDAQALHRAADDLTRRADAVGDRWRETRDVNHVAEAVVESIRRRVRHP